MKVIQNPAQTADAILGRQESPPDGSVRFLTYCVAASCDEGILLYNVLTKELILWEQEPSSAFRTDAERLNASPLLRHPESDAFRYLYEHWYLVPEAHDDRALCRNLRDLARQMHRLNAPQAILGYTILTTTDCNARCFYCYEAGVKRTRMSRVTAERTADFIAANWARVAAFYRAQGTGIPFPTAMSLRWFGGEPLCNTEAIDLITEVLDRRGVPFHSTMTTNAYGFEDAMVRRAVEQWRLGSVLISLDGTEETYNRRKAYVDAKGSAFLRVMDNIDRLLDAGVSVHLRLNVDEDNAADILRLAEDLAKRYRGTERLMVTPGSLFPFRGEGGVRPLRNETLFSLQDRLRRSGMMPDAELPRRVQINHCIADNEESILIQPDGSLAKCDHTYDSMTCGDIERGVTRPDILAEWKKEAPDFPACEHCPSYPDCIRLRNCDFPDMDACRTDSELREDLLMSFKRTMRNQFEIWRGQTEGARRNDAV